MPASNPNRPGALPKPKVARRVTGAPRSDIQGSGGNYGLPKAQQFKKTAPFKQAVQAAKTAKAQFPQKALADVKARALRGEFQHVLYATNPKHVGGKDWRGPGFYARKAGTLGLQHFWEKSQPNLNPDGSFAGSFKKQPESYAAGAKRAQKNTQIGSLSAPAEKVLAQVTRPIHGIAGAVDAVVTGKNPLKAAEQGFVHNKPYTFSDVLKHLGVPGAIAAPAGFVADVAADPLTYVTGGVGHIAVEAGAKEAARVEAKALAAGMTKTGAKTVAARAAKIAAEKAGSRKGVRLGVRAGIPFTDKRLVRQTRLVKAPKVVSKAATAVRNTPIVQGAGESLVHDFRPKHLGVAEHTAIKTATRRYRAQVATGERQVAAGARAVGKAAPTVQAQRRVIDLMEGAPADVQQHLADVKTVRAGTKGDDQELRSLRQQLRQMHVSDPRRGDLEAQIAASEMELHEAAVATGRKVKAPYGREEHQSMLAVAIAHDDLAQVESKLLSLRRREATAEGAGPAGALLRERLKAVEEEQRALRAQRDLALQGWRRHRTHDPQVDRFKVGAPGAKVAKKRLAANRVRPTTPAEEAAVRNLRATLDKGLKAEQQRGIRGRRLAVRGPEEAQAYLPHVRTVDVEHIPREAKGAPRPGGTVKVAAEHGRGIRTPLRTQRATMAELPFTENLPAIMAQKGRTVTQRVALHDLWKAVAATGRRIRPGDANVTLGNGEAIYRVTPNGLTEITRGDFGKIGKSLDKGEHLVQLHSKTVKAVEDRIARGGIGGTPLGHAFDRVQGTMKFLSTMPNPAFHTRNLIGDTHNAIEGHASANSFRQAVSILKSLHAREAGRVNKDAILGPGEQAASLSKTIKIRGKDYTHDQIIKDAEGAGAIRTGFAGSELRTLTHAQDKKHAMSLRAAGEYREDVPRLATFLSARKAGMTVDQAAEHSLAHHFDYGDLTDWERKIGRRFFPFYTFLARNTRLQLTKLVTEPGKAAGLQKLLEESAKAAGFKDYTTYVSNLTDTQQRGLPVPIKFGGQVYNAFASLPSTDLNQATTSPADLIRSLSTRLSFFKAIPEIAFNYSLFFHGQIQPPNAPAVKAPSLVVDLPGPLKKLLGVTKILDHQSGKMVWGWDKKADYALRQLPQSNQITSLLTPGAGSRGMTPLSTLVGMSGVKFTPYKPTTNDLTQALANHQKVMDAMGALRQRNISASNPTAEYRRLQIEERIYRREILLLRTQRGDKAIPGARRRAVTGKTIVAPASIAPPAPIGPPASIAPPAPASP